jgi:hypothetical protein
MMNVSDGMWYGILIISEIVILPYRIGNDIVERANKTYKDYKPGKPCRGYKD